MSIELQWGSSDRSILVWTFTEGWTSQDFLRAIEETWDILQSTSHRLHILIDLQHSYRTPDNILLLARHGLKYPWTETQLQRIVVIHRTSFFERLFQIGESMYPGWNAVGVDIHFARNANAAYNLLASRQR